MNKPKLNGVLTWKTVGKPIDKLDLAVTGIFVSRLKSEMQLMTLQGAQQDRQQKSKYKQRI